MATTDIRLKRLEKEYQIVRHEQDDILDRIDTYEAAILGLTEAVNRNTEHKDVLDDKLNAIMEHLQAPYKPQAEFVKECALGARFATKARKS